MVLLPFLLSEETFTIKELVEMSPETERKKQKFIHQIQESNALSERILMTFDEMIADGVFGTKN